MVTISITAVRGYSYSDVTTASRGGDGDDVPQKPMPQRQRFRQRAARENPGGPFFSGPV
jgi:hypothetical protein